MDNNTIIKSVEYIRGITDIVPKIGIILGSGLGEIAEDIENKIIIKYSDIPNMPISTVKGHAGQFVIGEFSGKNVIIMQGRFHYYEGNSMELLALPIYIMKYLGVENLIVTNAAGGVNTNFVPGDLMLIKDHINFVFNNPLIGKNHEKIGSRFPDMSCAYSEKLIDIAKEVSNNLNINIKEGVYLMMTGPCYETPAEIRMIRILGGDAVGMSTVPEVIAANHCNLEVLGISCITNMAAGILNKPLDHAEVMEISYKVKDNFKKLINDIVGEI
ncbi:purine nucleoside phosphorylase 1 [Clostridium pasteurianum DSM 525 = ATCC 6013]|uniref:Purine nucleoside phosphorylase n=1 Tax=Clostridium pasteurianum DSM 525 = ATCC 6013 TaxID=1262449 RepID=A0A0H3J7W9_CLOPA|nr:purine-nucleoside phosphorylase [Clostridium pasteurianum]AJA47998.1 purine nucleoside phosphorylase 1 [Clostridium pasteurianum DSM 525 = ATCC 6013]AJA51986.1 purine nucleoside phosphorylase 1 [Clostridium pasteurianum DSM 525 = ATCC 6013]AOZ75283.1 purine nucleoside phosphorylase [Clostridium pasteurianum DSM 525 = ATCC 6013]AOZ79078.1 purine nucleoside phosphorylase [Clostridium pasteurianum]ELP59901.1 purine nucleoside phosphorylase [Clostridium pasteurianum DSM 525 = ATCC 6013]